MTFLVAIDGIAPGVGKSTVAAALADHFIRAGLVVDYFREEDVLSRPACATLAEQFRTRGVVDPATLLEAAERYVASMHDVDVAVLDAFLPFIPSLLGWGYDDSTIDTFIGKLTESVAGTSLVLVYLDDDPRDALKRAIEREEGDWLNWLVDSLHAAHGPSVTDLDSLCEYFDRRRKLTLRLLPQHGWNVLTISDAITTSLPGMINDLAGSLPAFETP